MSYPVTGLPASIRPHDQSTIAQQSFQRKPWAVGKIAFRQDRRPIWVIDAYKTGNPRRSGNGSKRFRSFRCPCRAETSGDLGLWPVLSKRWGKTDVINKRDNERIRERNCYHSSKTNFLKSREHVIG